MITRREQGEAIGVLARYRELAKDLWTRPRPPRETSTHLRAALEWIYRAQDAGTDRGVSHSYVIGRGWLPSYAETTGYIIPTLLNWWHVYGDEEARRRALEMADWETDVQLEDGGVGSLASPGPVVFNTGQVLFGWIAAFEATFKITIYDAQQNLIADITAMSNEGQTLAPFSTTIDFIVTKPTPACMWVYEASARDGLPIHVVQISVTLIP